MQELTMNLEAGGALPLYEQIYRHIRDEIRGGGIHKGERLPSSRSLSSQLEVSRSTVDLAYAQLVSEGYVEAVPYKGYFACGTGELYSISDVRGSEGDEEPQAAGEADFDMKPSGIDLTAFPFGIWRKINRDLLLGDRAALLELGDPKGETALRMSICRYIHQARGVNCSPGQIVVGSGNDYLLMLLSFILEGKKVAMESPGYRHAYEVFLRTGFKVVTVPMDASGISVEALSVSDADLAYVMPSHQYPIGTVMPITRRQELIEWAKSGGRKRYIIEDDYDSEFRYRGKPIPALQGQEGGEKVIYLGTFSKSLAPAIRISYLVLPEELMRGAEGAIKSFSPTVSRLDQVALDTFIREGHFERHLNRMRRIYGRKQDILISELRGCGAVERISGERAGVHLTVYFGDGTSEAEAVNAAAEAGVRVYPLSECSLDRYGKDCKITTVGGEGIRPANLGPAPGVIVGYAGLTEEEIRLASERLKTAWDSNLLRNY